MTLCITNEAMKLKSNQDKQRLSGVRYWRERERKRGVRKRDAVCQRCVCVCMSTGAVRIMMVCVCVCVCVVCVLCVHWCCECVVCVWCVCVCVRVCVSVCVCGVCVCTCGPRLPRAVSTDELDELFEWVLMVVIADGGVGEVWTGLLDDGGGRKMKGRGWGTRTPWEREREIVSEVCERQCIVLLGY